MKYDEKGNELVFSTGRRVYCYSGVVGLDADHVGSTAYYGFDGLIPEEGGALTPAECIELAEHMIAAWTAYRDAMKALPSAEGQR